MGLIHTQKFENPLAALLQRSPNIGVEISRFNYHCHNFMVTTLSSLTVIAVSTSKLGSDRVFKNYNNSGALKRRRGDLQLDHYIVGPPSIFLKL
jgi:hypothetical protein